MDGGTVEQARKLAFCPAAKHDQQRCAVVAGDMQPLRQMDGGAVSGSPARRENLASVCGASG